MSADGFLDKSTIERTLLENPESLVNAIKENPPIQNSVLASGVFFYRLSTDGNVIDTKKMLLVK